LAFLPPPKLISHPPPATHHNTPNNTTLKADAHALANRPTMTAGMKAI
jgi:hypothetical protein